MSDVERLSSLRPTFLETKQVDDSHKAPHDKPHTETTGCPANINRQPKEPTDVDDLADLAYRMF